MWMRPDIPNLSQLDTLFFDVDGVLIDEKTSYAATVKASVRFIMEKRMDASPARGEIVNDEVIAAFKVAGGFNNDWVLTYTIAGLILSGAADTPADLIHLAQESAGRGMEWLQDTYFPQTPLSLEEVTHICMEHYWGEALLHSRLGIQARYYRGPGFAQREKAFVEPGFFAQLREHGILHLGLITGRDEHELALALSALGLAENPPFDVMIHSTLARKPDPHALFLAVEATRPALSLFIGDTGDDVQLVHNYRQTYSDSPSCLLAIVSRHADARHFISAGADIILGNVTELPDWLAHVRGHASSRAGGDIHLAQRSGA